MRTEGGRATREAADGRARRRQQLTLGLIVLVALILRVIRLNFQPLWWDEGWSFYFARMDPRAMLEQTAVDIHPPLYYLVLHLWTALLGSSPIAARLLSVLAGTAAVPLLYAAGRRMIGPSAGLVAAGLLALSPFHIFYSQEVRMYGLVTLFGLLALHFALDLASREPKRGGRLGYMLAAAAALYTEYYAAFLLLGLNIGVALWGWKARCRLREAVPWWTAQVAVALLYVPWLWYAGAKLLTYVRFKVSVEQDLSLGPLAYLGRHLAAFSWGHAEGILADVWWLGLLAPVVLAAALVVARLRRRRAPAPGQAPPTRHANPALWWGGIPCATLLLGGFVVNLVFPFAAARIERLLLLALPPFLLLVAIALNHLWRHWRGGAAQAASGFALLAIFSLSYFYTVPRYPDHDYRPVAARIQALSLPADALLCVHPWQVGYFEAYLRGTDRGGKPALILTPREVLPRERQVWAEEPGRLAADLDELLARHQRLWLPAHQAMGRVLESQIEDYLADQAYLALDEWYGDSTLLSLYAAGVPGSSAPLSPPDSGVVARFGGWLELAAARFGPGPAEAAWGVVPVDLTWRLLGPPDETYRVGIRLLDGAGRAWAQRDGAPGGELTGFAVWPVGEAFADRYGLLVPAGTPPGEYRLAVRVYRSTDLMPLTVDLTGGLGNDALLGAVRIARPATAPPVEALDVKRRRDIRFGDKLRFLGYNNYVFDVVPGQSIDVDLFWQALDAPGEDYLPRLQLLLQGEAVVAESTQKSVSGTYPTAWWQSGEVVRDPQALLVTADVPLGYYTLALSLIRSADGQPVEIPHGRTWVELGSYVVRGRDHRYEPTAPQYQVAEKLGRSVELAGYDLAGAAWAPGASLDVTLHWHALETPDWNYHVFVHLLDDSGGIVAQHDGLPGLGQLPPLGWLPGEYLLDHHRLQLPDPLPPGSYRLAVGLYDPVTSVRPADPILLDLSGIQ